MSEYRIKYASFDGLDLSGHYKFFSNGLFKIKLNSDHPIIIHQSYELLSLHLPYSNYLIHFRFKTGTASLIHNFSAQVDQSGFSVIKLIHFEIQIEQMLKVLYDFDAEAGTELTVKEGEVLTILSKDAGDGWWNARLVFTFIRVASAERASTESK